MVYVAASGAFCVFADVHPRLCVPAILLLSFPERLEAGEQKLTALFAAVRGSSDLPYHLRRP